jgi:hypothetical protein
MARARKNDVVNRRYQYMNVTTYFTSMKLTLVLLSPLSLLHRLAPISLFSPTSIDLSFPAYTPVLHLHTVTLLVSSSQPPTMGQATQELLIPFLGALQASVAVLLTILVGVIASQFQLIGIDSSKEISKVAVRLFLPALLIVNIGSQLHSDTVCFCSKKNCTIGTHCFLQ